MIIKHLIFEIIYGYIFFCEYWYLVMIMVIMFTIMHILNLQFHRKCFVTCNTTPHVKHIVKTYKHFKLNEKIQ